MRPDTPLDSAHPERPVERHPSPLLARAWWGDELLAETTAAVRVQEDGQPPALYFPWPDVRLDRFRDEGHEARCPVKGDARLWTIDGPETGVAGEDVLWRFTAPAPHLGWLTDLAAFDHDRVRVEVIESRPGGDPRDRTTKRFPTWGDAADLIDLLDVQPDGEGTFVGAARADWRRPVVEGSQMLGQAIVAARRSCGGRRPVSAQIVVLRSADAARPLTFTLDELASGRTFSTYAVDVTQEGRRCATATVLLDETAPDVMRHSPPPPADVGGPYDAPPLDMSVVGRDVRVVDGAYTGDPDAPVGPPCLDAWVRFRDVPDDQAIHTALLAQFAGHLSIAASMRPHAGIGQDQAHRSLSTAINAIAISFHADVAADQWMLYHHLSTFAGAGMTHSECRVHDEAGALLASFTVDAMVRAFREPGATRDERTAL